MVRVGCGDRPPRRQREAECLRGEVMVDGRAIVMQWPGERAMPSSISFPVVLRDRSGAAAYLCESLPEPEHLPVPVARSIGPAGR